jgi:hypothetical protein
MSDWKRFDEKRKRYGRDIGTTPSFPMLPYSGKFTIKQVAYLHAYCQKTPEEIVAGYPKAISLAQVHLALAHYFTDPKPIDSELACELRFNTMKGLDGSMSLPSRAEMFAAGVERKG